MMSLRGVVVIIHPPLKGSVGALSRRNANAQPPPTGAPPRRTPAELSKNRDAYLHVVTLTQYA